MTITLNRRRLSDFYLDSAFNEQIILQPGGNLLEFATNLPGELPGNGDPRKLAFRLWNFHLLD